jgi:hypothetical protein
MHTKKLFPLYAGMAGPLIFLSVFLIEGWLRPDYDPLSTFVSALSLGSRGWIQISNFIVFGLLFFVFSRAIAAAFRVDQLSQTGPTLLSIMAVCFFLSGPFVMDPMYTPRNAMTVHGTLHGIFGGMVFSLMPVTVFVFFHHFSMNEKWRSLRPISLILGIIIMIAVMLLTIATKFPSMTNTFRPWFGLIQRSALVHFMVWLFVVALRTYHIRRISTSES